MAGGTTLQVVDLLVLSDEKGLQAVHALLRRSEKGLLNKNSFRVGEGVPAVYLPVAKKGINVEQN